MTLNGLVADKAAKEAQLNRGHILALRIYTSPVSRFINKQLHDGCSLERPHPYPATVIMLVDAFKRLSKAQSDIRRAAVQRAKQLAEASRKAKDDPDADDLEKVNIAQKAVEAAAASEALHCSVFWRGVHSLTIEEFAERSAIETSFMSVSKDRAVATQDAMAAYTANRKRDAQLLAAAEAESVQWGENSAGDAEEDEKDVKQKSDPPALLFRVVTTEETMPVDLAFLTVFPQEAEWFYPPGMVLEKRTEWKDLLGVDEDGEKIECTMVELAPRLPQRAGEGRKRF